MVLTVIATLRVKEGAQDDMINALMEAQTVYLTHPGTLDWHITRKTGNPLEFVIVERFTDQTAFTYHSESSTCKDFVERVTPIVTGNDIQICEEIEVALTAC